MGLIISVLINLVKFPIKLYLFFYRIDKYREVMDEPFACPNCGAHFYAKWYHYFSWSFGPFLHNKSMKMKCPKCKERDMCKWTSEQDVDIDFTV